MQRLLDRAGYQIVQRVVKRSVSGKGWHVYIRLDARVSSWMEMVALQAILGSDRYREACNVQRVRVVSAMGPDARTFWEPRWNVFYDERR